MLNKYQKRLLEEWNMHGKIIIGLDFDDTISPWKFNQNEDFDSFNRVIKLLKDCKYTGAYIVVFTACNEDRYEEITKYCEARGLTVDAINKNPISLPYGNNGKIYANIFLDDRAGLNEALNTLETAMYHRRSEKEKEANKNLDDVA